jgi:hypothetical protein
VDYTINCVSAAYYEFMPIVVLVLVVFIVALPGFILMYLWKHRHKLYSTSIHQTIGWIYDPYIRGAEFWEVFEVLLKMILTGVLIYVPPTSRAGIAILICVVACCFLNFYRPHKNKIIFCLAQLSFLTTTTKYVVALLLSINVDGTNMNMPDQDKTSIGVMLIAMDIFFMTSSALAFFVSMWVLRSKIQSVNRIGVENKEFLPSTKITPLSGSLKEKERFWN